MNQQNNAPAMNQEIFNMGLSVETVSAYLICCSLKDADTVISTKNLLGMWNSSQQALIKSLEDLEKRNILRRTISGNEGENAYALTDVKEWTLE